jgi:tetratricopeptide (TPR) repeat protein
MKGVHAIMGVPLLLCEQTEKLLYKWHICMLTSDLEQASLIHNEIKQAMDNGDEENNFHYLLLYSRYLIMSKNFYDAHITFQQISPALVGSQNLLGYYYHFFKGILSTNQNDFDIAESHFREAFHLLKYVSEPEERADYFYKASILYYHTRQPLTAFNYASKAIKILEDHPGYEVMTADCENILGLACTSLKQYAKAEEHFLNALDLTTKHDFHDLALLTRYNIGYLYAEQNMPKLAIKYLTEVYEAEPPHFKTMFLLAREYFKENESEKAEALIDQGVRFSNVEYGHHFKILKCLQQSKIHPELQQTVDEGIDFFEKQELWGFVEDYAEALAKYFHENKKFETASRYFNTAYEARVKLQRKEALK